MKNMILLANDQSNIILFNSAMGFRYRVVAIRSVGADFVEPSTTVNGERPFDQLLDWITFTDGNLDFIQTWRAEVGADEVLLVNKASSYCGLAWVNMGLSRSYGYANYNGGCLTGRVWGHEIGHNFGCWHDRFSDPTNSARYPNYLGFGSCWEDTSKTGCVCYSSVMIYNCDTTPNRCTNCVFKNHYANYQVMDSGSATGTPTASCGLLMDQNHPSVVSYFPTTQSGGVITAVVPNYVVNTVCAKVNISGWQISTTGNDIISVTIGGYKAIILQQSMDFVTVLTPIVTSTTELLDVVVTTSTGRVTSLSRAFRYVSSTFTDRQTFEARYLPAGIWSDNGTLPWSFVFDSTTQKIVLYKDGSYLPDESYFSRLLWQSPVTIPVGQSGCTASASSIAFGYKLDRNKNSCYNRITLSIQQNFIPTWTQFWSGLPSYPSNSRPWVYVNLVLPSGTTAIYIFVNTAQSTNCRYYANGKDFHSYNLMIFSDPYF